MRNQKLVLGVVAVLSLGSFGNAYASDVFAYVCTPHDIVGYQPEGKVKEKVYLKSDLSLAVYAHTKAKDGGTQAYKVALAPVVPLSEKSSMVIYSGNGEDVMELTLNVAQVAVSLSRYPEAQVETFGCEPTTIESFDWSDAESAAGQTHSVSPSSIFDVVK